MFMISFVKVKFDERIKPLKPHTHKQTQIYREKTLKTTSAPWIEKILSAFCLTCSDSWDNGTLSVTIKTLKWAVELMQAVSLPHSKENNRI